MAKASRSKQPAFDPNELNDLIFSPAVGTGVSSHLLAKNENFPSPVARKSADPKPLHLSTVDTYRFDPDADLRSASAFAKNLKVLTDNRLDMTTVDTLGKQEPIRRPHMATVAMPVTTTVDMLPVSTVDMFEAEIETAGQENRNLPDLSTVDILHKTTVDTSDAKVGRFSSRVKLWITEQGDLIPEGRVKRIRLAQDAINSAEESVYDTLWTGKGSADNEASRVVQAGYDHLAKRTRLARKTIQRIVAKLIDKDFIAIERPADIYERTSTVYRVFSYKAVLDRHLQRGRTHVAKVGPGFSYVRPLDDPRQLPPDLDLSTVVTSDLSTVGNESTVTVVKMDLSTVVRETTVLIDHKNLVQTTTTAVREALSAYGDVDDDALARLIRSCKDQVADCTEQDIVHFIHEKGRLVKSRDSRIQNPIGFLIDAVPKCFAGETFRLWRQQGREDRSVAADPNQTEQDREWGREHESQLEDPAVPEGVKAFIRKCLGTN